MRLESTVEQFEKQRAAFGLRSTLRLYGLRAIQRVMPFKVLRGVSLSVVDPRFLDCPPGFSGKYLDAKALRSLAEDASYDLPSEFLDEAIAKGDKCYAILDGSVVAAYGWYADNSTRIGDELRLHFDAGYVYMYKGLTLDRYRGKRLHAIGMTRALAACLDGGKKGIVSYVESGNLSSLRSVYRMGYTDFGRVFIAGGLGRRAIYRTGGCKAFGFRVATEPVVAEAAPAVSVSPAH